VSDQEWAAAHRAESPRRVIQPENRFDGRIMRSAAVVLVPDEISSDGREALDGRAGGSSRKTLTASRTDAVRMKALIVLGHPASSSLNHALADAVVSTWRDAGCEVTYHDLAAEGFDPRLTEDEARGKPSMDPLVRTHISELRASDLLALIHPNCWGAPPAIMKGWIDRVFAPDAAYTFAKGTDAGDEPIGLLRTRAALVINTGNTPASREQTVFGDPLERIWRDCVLQYCGIQHVIRSLFSVVATSGPDERARWLAEARALATRAYDLAC
jgi:NAD(P)H dehydrogenase (quinone)